jgi:DNA (cytosine-5)-methyltransferase 1
LTKPRAFICENVKALAVLDKWTEVRQKLFSFADRLGYTYKLVILNSSDFGVPQSRERMFLIGFRDVEDILSTQIRVDNLKNSTYSPCESKKFSPNYPIQGGSTEFVNLL